MNWAHRFPEYRKSDGNERLTGCNSFLNILVTLFFGVYDVIWESYSQGRQTHTAVYADERASDYEMSV